MFVLSVGGSSLMVLCVYSNVGEGRCTWAL